MLLAKRKMFLIIVFLLLINQVLGQTLEQRLETEKSIELVFQQDSFLPLKRLDTLRVGIASDYDNMQIFAFSVRRYVPVFDKNVNLWLVLSDSQQFVDSVLSFGKSIVLISRNLNCRNKLIKALVKIKSSDSLVLDYVGQFIFGGLSGFRLKYTGPEELGLDAKFIYSKIDSIVENAIKAGAFPGAQVLAAKDGKVFFYKAYGFHTYDSLQPVDLFDIYDLASVTKIAATALCLMKLYDQGLLDLNANLGKLCPCVRFSNKANIKIIDALTHQARLTPWIPFWKKTVKNGKLLKRYYSTDSSKKYPFKVANGIYASKKVRKLIIKQIRKSKLLPKKQYKYSDLAFYLFPFIVERLSKNSFTHCLQKNFYAPLGAYTLTFNPYQKFPLSKIMPTEFDHIFRKQLIHGYVHDEGAAMMGGISGHAGLFANANDLAKIMQMLLNYGSYADKQYLNPKTVKLWTSYQFPELGNRRALAFDKPLLQHKELGTPSPLASELSFGHSGFTGTFVWADPKYNLIFIFLSNRVYPTRQNKKLLTLNVRTNIHTTLYKAIIKAEQ